MSLVANLTVPAMQNILCVMSETSDTSSPFGATFGRTVTEACRLQALAHPLRLRMLGLLRREGPSTATRLGRRCGESSGLTSYHLRQLASAGFVVDAEPADLVGKDSHGRARWWKAASEITVTKPPLNEDEAGAAVSENYDRAVIELYAERARAWLIARHTWPDQWQTKSGLGDRALCLTPAEVIALQGDLNDLLAKYRQCGSDSASGERSARADALFVSFQYQIFPDPEQSPPATSDRIEMP